MIDKEKYITRLDELVDLDDTEIAHDLADDIICELLNTLGYEDIVQVHHLINKWYASAGERLYFGV